MKTFMELYWALETKDITLDIGLCNTIQWQLPRELSLLMDLMLDDWLRSQGEDGNTDKILVYIDPVYQWTGNRKNLLLLLAAFNGEKITDKPH